LQIARVKPLGKPPVNRSKQFARFPHLALVAPEACEAHGGAEFPGFGLLVASDGEGAPSPKFSPAFRYAVIRAAQEAASPRINADWDLAKGASRDAPPLGSTKSGIPERGMKAISTFWCAPTGTSSLRCVASQPSRCFSPMPTPQSGQVCRCMLVLR